MEKLSLLGLFVICAVASSSELRLRCPEPTAGAPMAVYNMAWLCDLFKWRESIATFKKKFEKECNVTDIEKSWEEIFQCPDFSNITCMQDSSLVNRTDSFNCSIKFCKDGHYEDEDALPGIWRQQFHFHRTIMDYSDSINCTRECPVTETPVEEPSCAQLGKCCPGTDDSCLASSNGKTCHCDEICIHRQDCCSDHELVCRGDIDECQNGIHNCSQSATCTNTNGSYTCECNVGYTGNGIDCTDIDECLHGIHQCSQSAMCTNTNGNYTCKCYYGYTGNGIDCTDINECEEFTNLCGYNANCYNTEGYHYCACKPGYAGDPYYYCHETSTQGYEQTSTTESVEDTTTHQASGQFSTQATDVDRVTADAATTTESGVQESTASTNQEETATTSDAPSSSGSIDTTGVSNDTYSTTPSEEEISTATDDYDYWNTATDNNYNG